MALVRDLGMTLTALADTNLITCSVIVTTGSTSAPILNTATADVLISTGGASYGLTTGFGRTIDRIGPPLGTLYTVAMPTAVMNSTRGSTEANRQIAIGVKLQHGDSSAGGDMADYSTANQPAERVYFGTGRTTDMLNWEVGGLSTGALRASSNPAYYDLRGAKRYIRIAVRIGLSQRSQTTESTGEEGSRVAGTITFLGAADIPQVVDPKTSPYSTSTA